MSHSLSTELSLYGNPFRFLWNFHQLISSLKYEKPEHFSFLATTVSEIEILKVLGNFFAVPNFEKLAFWKLSRHFSTTFLKKTPFRWRGTYRCQNVNCQMSKYQNVKMSKCQMSKLPNSAKMKKCSSLNRMA